MDITRNRAKEVLEGPKQLNPANPSDFIKWAQKQPLNFKKRPTVEFNQLNAKQIQVVRLVTNALESGRAARIICHGEAGTGKSFVTLYLQQYCEANGIECRVMAFTGVAAFNSNGVTIQRALSMGLGYRNHPPEKFIEFPRKRLARVRLIILEEGFMIGISLFGYLERRLRAALGTDEPFGGRTILLLGDMAQLSPVADRRLFYRSPTADGLVADGIKAYNHFDQCVILTEVKRQDSTEVVFKTLLSHVRIGQITDEELAILESRVLGNLIKKLEAKELESFLSAPVIFADNKSVDEYNEKRIRSMDREIFEIGAVNVKTGEPTGHVLKLCVGARCMLTENLFVEAGLFNGAMVTVTSISKDKREEDGQPSHVFVRPDIYYGAPYPLRVDLPLVPRVSPIYDPFQGRTLQVKQYPLQLAYGMTAYKAQGKTCERVVIGNPVPGDYSTMFTSQSPQLLYVAMSRATTLDGIMFQQSFSPHLISPRHERGTPLEEWQQELVRLEQLAANTPQYN